MFTIFMLSVAGAGALDPEALEAELPRALAHLEACGAPAADGCDAEGVARAAWLVA